MWELHERLGKKKTLTLDWLTPCIVSLPFYNALNIKNLMRLYLDDIFQ